MLDIVSKVITPFAQNARLVIDSETKEALLLDPGLCMDEFVTEAEKRGAKITQIWTTHAHLDHAGGVAALKRKYGYKYSAHEEGRALRSAITQFAAMYGIDGMENCPEPDAVLKDGDAVRLGNLEFKVLHTPGHSPDSVCFYCAAEKVVFTGDTLMAGAIGRTDLPGGSNSAIMQSLKRIITELPEDTKICSGHGGDSELKIEVSTNPFLSGIR